MNLKKSILTTYFYKRSYKICNFILNPIINPNFNNILLFLKLKNRDYLIFMATIQNLGKN